MGPYATQEEAAAALLTVEGRHADGAFVWPEAVDDKEQRELVKEVCNG